MILKVERTEKRGNDKEQVCIQKNDYYEGKDITVDDILGEEPVAIIDNKPIVLHNYDAIDYENEEVSVTIDGAYLMNDNGKTIERLI